jgi:hypothetical protein
MVNKVSRFSGDPTSPEFADYVYNQLTGLLGSIRSVQTLLESSENKSKDTTQFIQTLSKSVQAELVKYCSKEEADKRYLIKRKGLTGTLTLDDGANWRIVLTFTNGILTSQSIAASSGAGATWA